MNDAKVYRRERRARRALKHRLIRKWPGFAKMHAAGEFDPRNYIDRNWERSYLSSSSSVTGIPYFS